MIIWFGGGLGNQLFQYALYRAVEENGCDVYADLSFYKRSKCHNGYELKRIFNIELKECDENQAKCYGDRYDLLARIIRKTINRNYGLNPHIIREKQSMYIEGLTEKCNNNAYLIGYWQSEQYFIHIKNKLRSELIFPDIDAEKNLRVIKEIKESNSVAIHVRRGDYLNKDNSRLFCNLGESHYYQNAVSYLKSKYNDLKYYVFSNDIQWCMDHLPLDNSTYIDWNRGAESYRDMQLFSACKFQIIANSSFSWWGAWLNNNPQREVLAPNEWFVKSSGYSDDMIIPKEWVKIDV